MKKIFKLALSLFIIGAIVISCDKENELSDTIKPDNTSRIIINNDINNLSKRIQSYDDFIMSLNDVPNYSAKKKKSGIKSDPQDENYVLKLRAEVEPYVHNGFELRATHVKIHGIYAYVSYNVEGPTYLGGIEVFDIWYWRCRDIKYPVSAICERTIEAGVLTCMAGRAAGMDEHEDGVFVAIDA